MAANRIYIQVDFQSAGATTAVNQLNQAISAVGPTTQKASQQASQGVNSLSLTIKQTQQSFKAVAGAISGLGLVEAGKQVLRTAADFDSLRRQLTLIEKDATLAGLRFTELAKMAEKPGLDLEPTIRGYVQLMQTMKVTSGEAVNYLDAFGKAIAQVGGGGQELDSALKQVTQMLAYGKVMQEDLRVIGDYVPQLRAVMQQVFQTADPEELRKRGVGAKQFLDGLVGGLSKLQDVAPGLKDDLDNINTEWRKMAEQAGKALAPVIIPLIKEMQEKLKGLTDLFNQLPKPLQEDAVKFLAAAAGISAIALALRGVATAIGAIGAAAAANPIVATILIGGGLIYAYREELNKKYKELTGTKEGLGTHGKIAGGLTMPGVVGRAFLNPYEGLPQPGAPGVPAGMAPPAEAYRPGKATVAPPAARAQTAEEKAAALSLKKWIEDVRQNTATAIDDAIADRQKELAKFLPADQQLAAQIDALTAERQKQWKDLITRVGPKGEKQVMPPKAQAELAVQFAQETAIRRGIIEDNWRREQIEKNKTFLKEVEQSWIDQTEAQIERRREYRIAAWDQEKEFRQRTEDENLRIQQQGIDARYEAEIAALEQLDDYTIQQKLAISNRRLEIEQRYVDASLEMQKKLLDLDKERELAQIRMQARLAGMLDSPEYQKLVDTTEKYYQLRGAGLESEAVAKREANRLKTIGDQSKMIRAEIQKTYEFFQRQAEGVFDALTTKSKSVWESLANFWKTTMLTIIKSIFTTAIAGSMTRLVFGNAAGASTQARTGGALGTIFGGGGGGGLGPGGWLQRLTGGPGGTGGFAGPVGTVQNGEPGWLFSEGAGGTATARSGAASMLGLGGLGLTGTLFNSGSIAMGGYSTTAAGIGGPLGGLAGFASSPAGIGAGALLAYMGVKRGGALGTALATGGGALAGFGIGAMIGSVGGPIGMAIGAAAGLTAGLIRTFLFKGATQKTKEKIKSIYGIDIGSNQILQQIVEIVKNQYGGDYNVGLYSPQVQELVRLYAMTQGISPAGMGRTMQPVTWSLSQGQGSIQSVYQGGRVVANPYTGPTSNQIFAAHGGSVYVQMDPAQANNLLEGRVVDVMNNNPGSVANAATAGMSNSAVRNDVRSTVLEPATVMA